jgi:FAD:protein FMN transferase
VRLVLSLSFCLFFLLSCSRQNTYKFQRNILDFVFSITIIEEEKVPQKKIEDIVERAYSEVARVYSVLSPHIIDSEFSRISNELMQGRKGEKIDIKVSPEFYNLISFSLSVSEKTGWSFDLSYKTISELWNKNLRAATPRIPGQSEINEAMLYSGKNSFELKGNNVIRFKKGAKFDFGGIIRGYAMERLSAIFRESGILNYIIEAGGDIVISGTKSGKPWNVALINPSDDKKNFGHCLVENENISIFTSVSFYGFSEINGKKYSDIIDMRVGKPADSDLSNLTFIAKDPKIADSYATAYYAYGFVRLEKQFEIFDKDSIGVIIVNSKGIRKMNSTAMKYCYLTE